MKSLTLFLFCFVLFSKYHFTPIFNVIVTFENNYSLCKTAHKLLGMFTANLHTRHAILVNRTSFWSTVNGTTHVDEVDTCHKYDIGLLHLGERKYAVIENKNGYSLADTINLIREYFVKKTVNAKTKSE